jgi:hypothetical protein
MRYLRAFLFGSVAAALLAGTAFAVISAVATSGGMGQLEVGIGPLVLLAVRRVGDTTESTIGVGLPLLALTAGALNAAALAVLSRRARSGEGEMT